MNSMHLILNISPSSEAFAKFCTSVGAAILLLGAQALAHCDALDGPVVQSAQKALDSGDVKLVLIWVQKDDEPGMQQAFEKTLAVRKLNAGARELADRYFFETVVRVHRAGEGAPHTGLKPAGQELGPAIPAADKALREGKIEPLLNLVRSALEQGVHRHFKAALKKRDFAREDVEAGREFVKAYVEYIHCVEALYQQATQQAHGHYPEAGAETHNAHKK